VNLTGPIPKRDEMKAGHNAKSESEEIDRPKMTGRVVRPDLRKFPGMITQTLTKGFWESLSESGQSQYYEPSDWMTALTALHLLDKQLASGERVSPTMVAAIWQMLTSIAVTEGERRRLRIEVERVTAGEDGDGAKVIPISQVYADRLRQQQQA
jgi:hypothetical protein